MTYTKQTSHILKKLNSDILYILNLKNEFIMLQINNLHAKVEGNEILHGINLEIKPGEIHAIMGPNGSGKSTLASVLAGKNEYEVTEGEVLFNGNNIFEMAPEIRSREGLFLAFQYPIEIPGVSNARCPSVPHKIF